METQTVAAGSSEVPRQFTIQLPPLGPEDDTIKLVVRYADGREHACDWETMEDVSFAFDPSEAERLAVLALRQGIPAAWFISNALDAAVGVRPRHQPRPGDVGPFRQARTWAEVLAALERVRVAEVPFTDELLAALRTLPQDMPKTGGTLDHVEVRRTTWERLAAEATRRGIELDDLFDEVLDGVLAEPVEVA